MTVSCSTWNVIIWLQSSSVTPTVKCLLSILLSSIQQVTPVQKEGTLHRTKDGKIGKMFGKSFLHSVKKTIILNIHSIWVYWIADHNQQNANTPFFHPLSLTGLNTSDVKEHCLDLKYDLMPSWFISCSLFARERTDPGVSSRLLYHVSRSKSAISIKRSVLIILLNYKTLKYKLKTGWIWQVEIFKKIYMISIILHVE